MTVAQLERVDLPGIRDVLQAPILAAIAYFIGAEAAFLVGTLSDRIFAPFWPPNVVLFCALLIAPRTRWWLYVAAAFPAHVIAELQVGMNVAELLVAFATNCAVAVLNAELVRKVLIGPPWLGSLKKAALYILITALASPAVVAFGGAFVPILGGGGAGSFLTFWAQWYLSNALGFLTLGPIFLIWLGGRRSSWAVPPAPRLIEAAALGMALVVVCTLAFRLSAGTVGVGFVPAVLYSPLPLILWCATRFGEKGASAAILVVTVVLLWLTLNSASMFIAGNPETNVFALQVFLVALSIPVLLLGASIDEARRAEQATRESEERMRFAAESANIGLWYFEQASDRIWATVHCRSMLGIASDVQLTPKVMAQAIHPDDRQLAIEAMKSAARAGQQVVNEFRVVLPDGRLRWLRAWAHADRDDRGAPFRVSGMFMDITAAKAAEQEGDLQRRELAHLMRVSVVGELSGALAHELNQPLTAILSNAQAARLMLARRSPKLYDVSDVIDDIVDESKRAGEVIGRLRGLLKKGESKLEPIDLNQLIQSTIQLLHSELIGRRFKVKLELAKDLPPVYGDVVQLQQVLLNLAMNAMEAMAGTPLPRRTITISTRLANANRVEAVVADHGHGLAHADRARAFEPFFTTKEHGLGLGLSICSSIIGAHGGQLGLANDVNGGARATFTLPRRQLAVAAK